MRSAAHAPGHAQPTPPWGGDTGLRSLETRVSAEFRDMPGMVLTTAQAARLFGLDAARCEQVLATLVAHGVLATDGRAFYRADLGAHCA